jgi:hypothetical protein
MILNHLIDLLGIDGASYVKWSTLSNEITKLSNNHWLPAHIERYVLDNITSLTGLNKKYRDCSFCGEVDVIFTSENKGVSELDSLCGDKCRLYFRMKKKCSDSFFKHIPKKYKASEMTIMLYALQKRAKTMKKLKRRGRD